MNWNLEWKLHFCEWKTKTARKCLGKGCTLLWGNPEITENYEYCITVPRTFVWDCRIGLIKFKCFEQKSRLICSKGDVSHSVTNQNIVFVIIILNFIGNWSYNQIIEFYGAHLLSKIEPKHIVFKNNKFRGLKVRAVNPPPPHPHIIKYWELIGKE